MKCPVCSVATTVVEHNKIELDYCSKCHGIWFDRGELELLLDTLTGGTAAKFIDGMLQRPQEKVAEKTRKCPICGKKMTKAGIGAGKEIMIDVCGAGHGLWFDGGECGRFFRQIKLEQPAGTDALYEALFFIRDTFRVSPGAPGNPG
jgi:Zn-finger nucleic acid-binding protein